MEQSVTEKLTITWQATNGWLGGTVTALALSPHFAEDRMVLAGTFAGSFLSLDGGMTWQRAGDGMADPQITALVTAATPSGVTALAATASGQLYRTMWDGETAQLSWQQLDSWRGFGVAQAMLCSPAYAEDQTIFVATVEGIFRSQDGGATWESSTFGLLDLDILCLACAPDFAQSEVLWAGSAEGGLYRSRNGARSWRDSGVGLPDSAIQCLLVSPHYADDHTLYVGTERAGVYRSTDGSATWQPFASALAELGINDLACSADQRQWLVATADGLYSSHDGGVQWTPAVDPVRGEPLMALNVALNKTSALAALFLDGFARSDNGGATWALHNRGLTAHAAPFTQWTAAGELVALDLDGQLASYHATDQSWQAWNQRCQDAAVTAIAKTTDRQRPLLVTTEDTLFVQQPAAVHWESLPLPAAAGAVTLLAPSPTIADDQTLFIGNASGQLWRSADNGVTWQQLAVPWANGSLLQLHCSPFFLRDQLLYAVTATPAEPGTPMALTIWQGGDGGATWQALADLQSNSAAVALHLPRDPVERPILLATRNRLIKLEPQLSDQAPMPGMAQWQIGQSFLPDEVWITDIVTTPDFIEDRLIYLTTTRGVVRGLDPGGTRATASIEWQPAWPEIADQTIVGLHCTGDGQPEFIVGLGGQLWRLASS